MARRKATPEELAALGVDVPKTRRPATAEELAALGVAPKAPPEVSEAETFALGGAEAIPAGGVLADVAATGALTAARNSFSSDGLRRLAAGNLRRWGRENLPKIPLPLTDAEIPTSAVTDVLSSLTPPAGPGAVLTPRAQMELISMGVSEEEASGDGTAAPGPLDTYRTVRDTRRERSAAGTAQNPKAAAAGATLGTAASLLAPLPKTSLALPVRGADRANRILNAAATGAGYGAFNELVDGDADLTRGEVSDAGTEVLGGALGGAALGGGLGVVADAAINPLRRLAVRQGKQTIQGSSDIAAATREPLADDAVEEVLRGGAIRPFSTTQAAAQRIEDLVAQRGQAYASLIQRLEDRGVTGPDALRVADVLTERAARLRPRTMNTALPDYLEESARTVRRASGQERPGFTLNLTQAEDLKRSAQEMARYGKFEETPLNAVKREVASVLRRANEDAVAAAGRAAPAGSEVRTMAQQFVPVKQGLGRLLEAERFAQKGASKAEQRSPVSFKDLLLGSTTGNPLAAAGAAGAMSIARNRLPSTVAAGSYRLAAGAEEGSDELARVLALTLDPNALDTTQALIEALRRKKEP